MRATKFVSRVVDTSPHWAETNLFREALPFLQVSASREIVHLAWQGMGIRLAQRMIDLEAPCACCARRFHVVVPSPMVARSVVAWTNEPPRLVRVCVACPLERNELCFKKSLRGYERQKVQKAHKELVAEIEHCKAAPSRSEEQLSLFARRS